MDFPKYLFPGFIIGPIVASTLVNLANGLSLINANEIGMLGLFVAGLGATVAFFAVDHIVKH